MQTRQQLEAKRKKEEAEALARQKALAPQLQAARSGMPESKAPIAELQKASGKPSARVSAPLIATPDGKVQRGTPEEFKKIHIKDWEEKLRSGDPTVLSSANEWLLQEAHKEKAIDDKTYNSLQERFRQMRVDLNKTFIGGVVDGKQVPLEWPRTVFDKTTKQYVQEKRPVSLADLIVRKGNSWAFIQPKTTGELETILRAKYGKRDAVLGKTKAEVEEYQRPNTPAETANMWLGSGLGGAVGFLKPITDQYERLEDWGRKKLGEAPYKNPIIADDPTLTGRSFASRFEAARQGTGAGVKSFFATPANWAQNADIEMRAKSAVRDLGITDPVKAREEQARQEEYLRQSIRDLAPGSNLLMSDWLDKTWNRFPESDVYNYGMIAGETIPVAVTGLRASIGLMNATSTLGARALAPVGMANTGRTIGLVTSVAAPVGVRAFRDQLSKPSDVLKSLQKTGDVTPAEKIVRGIEAAFDPVGTVFQGGMSPGKEEALSQSDPSGAVRGFVSTATNLGLMAPGAPSLWNDVKSQARDAVKLYNRSTAIKDAAGIESSVFNSAQRFTNSFARIGRNEIGKRVAMDLGFGATQPLGVLGEAAYAHFSERKPGEERHYPTAVDYGLSVLHGLVSSRPGKFAHSLINVNPLGAMEPQTAAMDAAVNIINRPDRRVELLHDWLGQTYGRRFNDYDVRLLASEMSNDNLGNIQRRLAHVGGAPDPAFKNPIHYVREFINNPDGFSEATRQKYTDLIENMRGNKDNRDHEPDSPLTKVRILDDLNPATKGIRTQELTARFLKDINLQAEAAKLASKNQPKPSEPVQKQDYYGLRMMDGRVLVFNKDLSSARIIESGNEADITMLAPNSSRELASVDPRVDSLVSLVEGSEHIQNIVRTLIESTFIKDGKIHKFFGLDKNGNPIFALEDGTHKTINRNIIGEYVGDSEFTSADAKDGFIPALKYLAEQSGMSGEGEVTSFRKSGVNPLYPHQHEVAVPDSENDTYGLRPVLANNDWVMHQSNNGSIVFTSNNGMAKGRQLPPIDVATALDLSNEASVINYLKSLNPESASAAVPVASGQGGVAEQGIIHINDNKTLRDLIAIAKSSEKLEDKLDAIKGIVSEYVKHAPEWQDATGVKSDVRQGSIIESDGKTYLVIDSDGNIAVARDITDIEGANHYILSGDAINTNAVRHDVLERIFNDHNIGGVDRSMIRPVSSGTTDLERAMAEAMLTMSTGADVYLFHEVVDASHEDLPSVLLKIATQDHADYLDLYKSLVVSLSAWIDNNPELAHMSYVAAAKAFNELIPTIDVTSSTNSGKLQQAYHLLRLSNFNPEIESAITNAETRLGSAPEPTGSEPIDVTVFSRTGAPRTTRTTEAQALIVNAALGLNRALLGGGDVSPERMNRELTRIFKLYPSLEANKEAAQAKILELAGLLRSVHPLIYSKVLGSPRMWMINKFSGLPAEIQALAAVLPERGPENLVGPNPILATEAGYTAALEKVRSTYNIEKTLGTLDDFKQELYQSGLGFFWEVVHNPEYLANQSSERSAIANDIRRARVFNDTKADSLTQMLVNSATAVYVDTIKKLAQNQSLPADQQTLVNLGDAVIAQKYVDMEAAQQQLTGTELMLSGSPTSQEQSALSLAEAQATLADVAETLGRVGSDIALVDASQQFGVGTIDNGTGQEIGTGLTLAKEKSIEKATFDAYSKLTDKEKIDVILFNGAWPTISGLMSEAIRSGDAGVHDSLLSVIAELASGEVEYPMLMFMGDPSAYNQFKNDVNVVRQYVKNASAIVGSGADIHGTVRNRAIATLRRILATDIPIDGSNVDNVKAWLNFQNLFLKAFTSRVLEAHVTGASKNLKVAQNTIIELERQNRNLLDVVRMASLAQDANMGLEEYMKLSKDVTGAVINFMGFEFSAGESMLISDAVQALISTFTPAELAAPGAARDLVERAAELEQAIVTAGGDMRSLVDSQGQANVTVVEYDRGALGRDISIADPNAPQATKVNLLRANNRAGLEKLFLSMMWGEAANDNPVDVTILDAIAGKFEESQQLKQLTETRNLQTKFRKVFLPSQDSTFEVAVMPGSGRVHRTNRSSEDLVNGQVFFNSVYEQGIAATKSDPVKQRKFIDAMNALYNDGKSGDTSKISMKMLQEVLSAIGLRSSSFMAKTNLGNTFVIGMDSRSQYFAPYMITTMLTAMDVQGKVRVTADPTTPKPPVYDVRDQIQGDEVNYDRSVANNLSKFSIFSTPEDMSKMTVEQLEDMVKYYNLIVNKNSLSLNATDLAKAKQIRDAYQSVLSEYGANKKARDVSAVTTVVTNKANAIEVARQLAKLYDIYSLSQAERDMEADIDLNTASARSEYLALMALARIDSSIIEQFAMNNASIASMTKGKIIGPDNTETVLLSPEQLLRLRSLRLAQLQQNFYNQDNQLFATMQQHLMDTSNLSHRDNPEQGEYIYGMTRELGRTDDAVARLLYIASKKGFDRTAHTIAHEVSHVLFLSLPDYMQVEYLKAVMPEKGTEGADEKIQPAMADAYKLIKSASDAYALHINQGGSKHTFKLKNTSGWDGWGTVLHEMTATSFVNFLTHDGVVYSGGAEKSRADNVTAVLHNLGNVLRPIAERLGTASAGNIVMQDGNAMNAYFLDPAAVKYQSTVENGNERTFYPLQHYSWLNFTVHHQRDASGALRSVTPFDMMGLVDANNPFMKKMFGGNYDRVKSLLNKGGVVLDSSLQVGRFINNSSIATELASGQRATGRVVGMVMSTDYVTQQEAQQAGAKYAFTMKNAKGKDVIWIDVSNDNNKMTWYKLQFEGKGKFRKGQQRSGKKDYMYIVETTGDINMYEKDGDRHKLMTDGKMKQQKVRILVGHDAFSVEDKLAKPYIVSTGKINTPQFNNVVYSMLARVDKSLTEMSGQLNYDHQQGLIQSLAKEYAGVEEGSFTNVYGANLYNLVQDQSLNIGQRIANADKTNLSAQSIAAVDPWVRYKYNNTQFRLRFTELLPELGTDALDLLSSFLYGQRQNMMTPDGRLSTWHRAVPVKYKLGFSQSTANSDKLLTQWMVNKLTSLNEIQNFITSIKDAVVAARNSGETTITVPDPILQMEGTSIDVSSIINGMFSPDMTDNEINATAQIIEKFGTDYLIKLWASTGSNGLAQLFEAFNHSKVNLQPLIYPSTMPTTFEKDGIVYDVKSAIDKVFNLALDPTTVRNYVGQNLRGGPNTQAAEITSTRNLDIANQAVLYHIMTKVFRDQQSQVKFMKDLLRVGHTDNNTTQQLDHINALNMFNVVSHIFATDSRLRTATQRNWNDSKIIDINGDDVIFEIPDRDIAIAAPQTEQGSVVRVNLKTGVSEYVVKTKKLINGEIVDRWEPAQSVDKMYGYNATSRPNDPMPSTAQPWTTKANGQRYTSEQMFGGDRKAAEVLKSILGQNEMSRLVTDENYSTVILLPNVDAFKTGSTEQVANKGISAWSVSFNKDTGWSFKEQNSWWNEAGNPRSQNLNALLKAAMPSTLSDQTREGITKLRVLNEEYHIAKLLVAREAVKKSDLYKKLGGGAREQLFPVADRTIMGDISGDTWYSKSPTGMEAPEPESTLDYVSDIELVKGGESDYPTLNAFWKAKITDEVIGHAEANAPNELVIYKDPNLQNGLGKTLQGKRVTLNVGPEMWPIVDEIMKSRKLPLVNANEAISMDMDEGLTLFSKTPFEHAVGGVKAIGQFGQYILGFDLSTIGIQGARRAMNDPLGAVWALTYSLPSMVMLSRDNLPFFAGYAADLILRGSRYNAKWTLLGNAYYEMAMEAMLKHVNLANKSNYTMAELAELGWKSDYYDWKTKHALNRMKDPSKYKALMDTPFEVDDEFISGAAKHFVGISGRWDQTRLLWRDLFSLKQAVDNMELAEGRKRFNVFEKQQQNYRKNHEIRRDKRALLLDLALDMGLTKFSRSRMQAPLLSAFGQVWNSLETAPGYNRSFIHGMNLDVFHGAKTRVNGAYMRLMRNGPKFLRGNLFDTDFSDYYTTTRTPLSSWAKESRLRAQVATYLTIGALMIANSKRLWDQEHEKEAFDWREFTVYGLKNFGYIAMSPTETIGIAPFTKLGGLLRPVATLLEPSESTVGSKANAIGKSILDSYVINRWNSLSQATYAALTGTSYGNRPSFSRNEGMAIAAANQLRPPLMFRTLQDIAPVQSNFLSNFSNYTFVQAWYEDLAKYAAAQSIPEEEIANLGQLDTALAKAPVISNEEAMRIFWKGYMIRMLGFGYYVDPEKFQRKMDFKLDLGLASATVKRLSYLERGWWKYATIKDALADSRGLTNVIEGFEEKEFRRMTLLGFVPESAKKYGTKIPLRDRELPLGANAEKAREQQKMQDSINGEGEQE